MYMYERDVTERQPPRSSSRVRRHGYTADTHGYESSVRWSPFRCAATLFRCAFTAQMCYSLVRQPNDIRPTSEFEVVHAVQCKVYADAVRVIDFNANARDNTANVLSVWLRAVVRSRKFAIILRIWACDFVSRQAS